MDGAAHTSGGGHNELCGRFFLIFGGFYNLGRLESISSGVPQACDSRIGWLVENCSTVKSAFV